MVNMYNLINNLMPRNLGEHEDYQVLVQLFSQIASEMMEFIDNFPSFVDIDTCPDIFLPKLSYLVGHEIKKTIPLNYQREVLSRVIQSYKNRGSYDSIQMAATWGDEDTWVADHIFYPGSRPDNYPADLITPIDNLFVHSKSKFSGGDKFPDKSYYRDGTLQITSTNLNDDIRQAVKKVVPAGIKIFFVLLPFGASNIVKDYGEWNKVSFDYYVLEMHLSATDPNHTISEHSTKVNRGRGRSLSGNRNLYEFYDIYSIMTGLFLPYSKAITPYLSEVSDLNLFDTIQVLDDSGDFTEEVQGEFSDETPYTEVNSSDNIRVVDDLGTTSNSIVDSKVGITYSIYSDTVKGDYDDKDLAYTPPKHELMVDISYESEGIDVETSYLGIQKRSMVSGIRSGKYSMSGAFVATIDGFASFDSEPVMYSPLYPVGRVSDMKISDVGFNNTAEIEILIARQIVKNSTVSNNEKEA